MKKIALLLYLTGCVLLSSRAQDKPYSQRMVATAMNKWRDTSSSAKWTYEQAVVLNGIEQVWLQTGDKNYYSYIQNYIDRLVANDGIIKGYKKEQYTLDNLLPGRPVLMLYNSTNAEKYYKAANILRDQLKIQPRVPEGGFWHKQVYPNQMWLDGLYMGGTFFADYAATFGETADYDDICNQFILMEKVSRDPKTGLLYHAWDASKKERWANPKTGLSANFWARADGWYAMALVDVLDKLPADHAKRPQLIAILNRLAAAIQKYQDPRSGVWYEVLDMPERKGNYLESSASCMFVYALLKGVRLGCLPESYLLAAKKGYKGIIKQFISTNTDGSVNLNGTVSVGGLGGTPYRDGSYEYYLSEKIVSNDGKGVGSFIMASVEMEKLPTLNAAKGKTVLLDSYYNNEHRQDKLTGKSVSFHYKWEETDINGYSILGHLFNNYGFKTQTLYQAPTSNDLKQASVYIVADPDIPKENPDTKYIEAPQVKTIGEWVKEGGVLLVLANDTGNAEFPHLNKLLGTFGIKLNSDSRNHVTTPHFETGAIMVPEGNTIFKTAKKVYIKELSTFSLTPPATSALTDKGDVIIATANYGKGTVFAVGDPWFYNEYTDGRKLPADYDNYKAADDLVRWVTQQLPRK